VDQSAEKRAASADSNEMSGRHVGTRTPEVPERVEYFVLLLEVIVRIAPKFLEGEPG
jgi:hypothetical protein